MPNDLLRSITTEDLQDPGVRKAYEHYMRVMQYKAPDQYSQLLAPFNLAETAGTLAYTNLLMPALNAAGLSRRGSLASEYTFDRESMLSPDWSPTGMAGMLGHGRWSGFRNAGTGEALRRDEQHGSAYSSALAARNPEAYGTFAGTTGGNVALMLADIGVDPLTAIGLGSGAAAVTKARGLTGLVPFNRLMRLAPGGLEGAAQAIRATGRAGGLGSEIVENYVRNVLRARLGREPTIMEALIGAESPHEFFRKGILFNRSPVAEMSGKIGEAVGKAPSAGRIPAETIPREERIQKTGIDDILARGTGPGQPPAMVLDAMTPEQMLEEAGRMAGKAGLYGDIADDVTQEAILRTLESLKAMPAREGGNAANKIRATLKGHVQHAMRSAKKRVGGITGVPAGETAKTARFEDVFGEPSAAEMFSLKRTQPAQATDVRKALASFGEVDRVEDMEGGALRVTMANGKQMVAELGQTIVSPEAGKTVGGRFFLDQNGIFRMQFTPDTDLTDVFEELTHGLVRTGLLDQDMPALKAKFARGIDDAVQAEEAIVKGLKLARFSEDTVARKIWNFLVSVYETLTGRRTAAGTIRRIVKGEYWQQPMKSDPLAFLNKRTDAMTLTERGVAMNVDPLTGLKNVRAYEEAAKKPGQLAIDLDGMKWVNDTFGHEVGNRYLRKFSEVINALGFDAYRKGGDEFVAQFDSLDKAARGKDSLDKALKRATLKVTDAEGNLHEFGIHASSGAGQSYREADAAAYSVKARGRTAGEVPHRGEPLPSHRISGRSIFQQETGSGPLGSHAIPETVRYSVTPDETSALARATSSGHVRGIFDTKETKGFVEKLKTTEGRADLFAGAAEKGWDELYRVRKAMIAKASGKLVHQGRAAANVLLQNLSGLLSHTKHVIEHGIKNPYTGQYLYKGNMIQEVQRPIVEYLQKTRGIARSAEIEQALREADAYIVSRRAAALHDQAMKAADDLAAGIAKGAPPDNPLIYRRIIGEADVEKASAMTAEEARQFLTEKAEAWARTNTGLAKATGGASDIEEARAIIREVEADPEKLAALDKVRSAVSGIGRAKLEYAYAKGMIRRDLRDYLLQTADDYAPLLREMEETIHARPAGSGADLVKTLRGSEREILNPVTSSVEQAVNWMRRSDINEVFARWLGDADEEYLQGLGVSRVGAGESGNIKTVLIDGERTFWKFEDESLYRSVERIGRAEPQDAFTKILGAYKRIVRDSVTHSPGFPVRNFIRDSFMRSILSEHGTGIASGFRRFTAEEIDAFIAAGGDQAGYYGRVAEEYAKQLKQSIRQTSRDAKTVLMRAEDAKNFITGAWDKWGDFLAKGEMQNRLAEFRAAREQVAKEFPGLAAHEVDRIAAYKARRLMDFAVIGEWGRKINNFVPFFNPAIQGTKVILEAAAKNPRLFTQRLVQYVGLPSIGCYLYNVSVGADKEYRQLPAYRRDLYWNFKIGDTWLVVPKPFEAGVLGTTFERAIDFAATGKAQAFAGVLPSRERGDLGTLLKSMSPVDEALFAGPFRPVLEILANRDLFRDSYIIPPHEEGLDPQLRKGAENASGVGKILSRLTGQIGVLDDPRQWDYLLRGLFSEYGRMATDFTGPQPGKELVKNLSGGFMRKSSPWGLQSVQDAMREAKRKGLERRKEHRQFVAAVRGAAETPTSAAIDEILKKAETERARTAKISIDEILQKRK